MGQIDHVELEVPNRYEAAHWYCSVLGFEICREYEPWAETAGGPLMISTVEGGTKLALFEGCPQGAENPVGFRRVAFRTGATEFLAFVQTSDAARKKNALELSRIIDHQKSFSVYFSDLYGNRLEVTTYDYEAVRVRLESLGTDPGEDS